MADFIKELINVADAETALVLAEILQDLEEEGKQ